MKNPDVGCFNRLFQQEILFRDQLTQRKHNLHYSLSDYFYRFAQLLQNAQPKKGRGYFRKSQEEKRKCKVEKLSKKIDKKKGSDSSRMDRINQEKIKYENKLALIEEGKEYVSSNELNESVENSKEGVREETSSPKIIKE